MSPLLIKILIGILLAVLSTIVPVATAMAMDTPVVRSRQLRGLVERPQAPAMGLQTVGGHDDVKRVIRAVVIVPLSAPDVFLSRGAKLPCPRNVLLHGPPGTGKTMIVKATAAEAQVPLVPVYASTIESKWWGEAPKMLSAMLKHAESIAPAILFFDELDGIGRTRCETDQACVYSLKCELLRLIDTGVEGVIVMACTNYHATLDAALKRRFQTHLYVGPPGVGARAQILERLTHSDPMSRKLLQSVAHATDGFTGADLAAAYSKTVLCRLEECSDGSVVRAGMVPRLKARHWSDALGVDVNTHER